MWPTGKKEWPITKKRKLNPHLIQNYSFHAGSPIAYSTTTSLKESTGRRLSILLSRRVQPIIPLKRSLMVLEWNSSTMNPLELPREAVSVTATETVSTLGFNLASNGTDDYFSIDLNRAPDNSLVFHTKGGASACPYFGATISKYYQPGTVIDQPTQRIEVPVLSVDNPVVNDIPSSRKATYNLTLRNESEAKLPATFILGYIDNDSNKRCDDRCRRHTHRWRRPLSVFTIW